MIKNFTARILTLVLATGFISLAPVLVHAASNSIEVGQHNTLSTEVKTEIGNFVVTHESATADVNADENAVFNRTSTSTTGNATSSAARLRAHASIVAKNDADIQAIALDSDKVSVTYREPAKLFGFFTIHVPVRVAVGASGTATVSYPWYRFLMSTDQAGLAVRAQAIADQQVSTDIKTTAKFSADAETRIIDSLQAMLKSEADAEADATVE